MCIGETCRSIRTRTREKEHKRAIRNIDGDHSGISKHVLETGHSILWDGVKILAYKTDWRKQKIKKGIFIHSARGHTLNSKPGVSVSSVYYVLE